MKKIIFLLFISSCIKRYNQFLDTKGYEDRLIVKQKEESEREKKKIESERESNIGKAFRSDTADALFSYLRDSEYREYFTKAILLGKKNIVKKHFELNNSSSQNIVWDIIKITNHTEHIARSYNAKQAFFKNISQDEYITDIKKSLKINFDQAIPTVFAEVFAECSYLWEWECRDSYQKLEYIYHDQSLGEYQCMNVCYSLTSSPCVILECIATMSFCIICPCGNCSDNSIEERDELLLTNELCCSQCSSNKNKGIKRSVCHLHNPYLALEKKWNRSCCETAKDRPGWEKYKGTIQKEEIGTWSLFHCSIYYGKADVVKVLMNKSSRPNLASIPTGQGILPIHLASVFPDPEIAHLLIQNGANPNDKTPNGHDAFQIIDTKIEFFKAFNEPNLLRKAQQVKEIFNGNISTVVSSQPVQQSILDVDTNSLHDTGKGVVLSPTTKDSSNIIDKIKLNLLTAEDITQEDVGIILDSEQTLLHIASQFGSIASIDILVQKGAQLDARNNVGQTPLHLAVMVNRPKIVDKLLLLGAKPNLEDDNNASPHDMAKKMNLVGITEKLRKAKIGQISNTYGDNNNYATID